MLELPKPTTGLEEPGAAGTSSPERWRQEVIGAGVLAALGRPARLLKVTVLPLWGNNFRVNVWTGEGASADGIPNSYFVTADDRGVILRSEPPIQKQY